MNNEIKTISPFKNFCVTIGALPTSYLESMSYYEMLCWFCKYLENTINPAINSNAEALKELQEYVANYFDNLDVQTEINNKLDDMAESGELAEIINVEMIGSLSDLITTDKTNLVSAINENAGKIESLNINTYTSYTSFTTVTGSGTGSGRITVAKSTDGTICKVYGTIDFNGFDNDGSAAVVKITSDTGLRPTTSFTVELCGFGIVSDYDSLLDSFIRFNTDGTLEFIAYPVGNCIYKYIPFVIFVKDFGDNPGA